MQFELNALKFSRVDPGEFVRFWAPRDPGDDSKYSRNLLHPNAPAEYDLNRVTELLEWKAGRFEKNARAFAKRVDMDALNAFRVGPCTTDSLQAFWDGHASGLSRSRDSIIWPIFICHIAHPDEVPIYDVNVWHAWLFLRGELTEKLLRRTPTSFPTYLNYRSDFNELVALAETDVRAVDKALMAFGQFISSGAARTLGLSTGAAS
jgi:hypothetical protein